MSDTMCEIFLPHLFFKFSTDSECLSQWFQQKVFNQTSAFLMRVVIFLGNATK